MSLSLLTPSRTVLMITDDSLYIYSSSGKGVELVNAVPWDIDNFLQDVSTILAKDCSGKPVLIINDMVEQHYKKIRVPKVGVLDQQNVLKRKLQVEFASYPVRAALALKQKTAKSDKSLGGRLYVFAAVPASDAFSKTMESTEKSLANIAGFCLLPIESSDMIKKLSEKMHDKGATLPKWTVFIGQHQSGGLRQVVVRDGELALTRMTAVGSHDENPMNWAREVQQEFKSTMSYLSRFGYTPDDGLSVIVIAPQATGDIINELIDVPCEFKSYSVDEAASVLNLKLGDHEHEHFADILHVAWIGRKSKFILPMKAKQIDNVSKPRQIALAASLLLFLGGAFQAYLLVDGYQKLLETKDDLTSRKNQKAQLELRLEKEIKRKKDMGFDIQLIQSSLSVYDRLEEQQIRPFDLYYKLAIALGPSLRIDAIDISRQALAKVANSNRWSEPEKVPKFISTVQLTFPSDTNAERGNQEVRDLRDKLQRLLPDHVVTAVKMLEDYEYSEEIVIESGESNNRAAAQDYVAELRIEGPAYK